MSYASSSTKRAMRARMHRSFMVAKKHEERFPTLTYRLLTILIGLDKYISWGPWRDMTTRLYTKPFNAIDIYVKGRYSHTERRSLKDLDDMVDLTEQDKKNDLFFTSRHHVYAPQLHAPGDLGKLGARIAQEVSEQLPRDTPHLIQILAKLNHTKGMRLVLERHGDRVLIYKDDHLILRIVPPSHPLNI